MNCTCKGSDETCKGCKKDWTLDIEVIITPLEDASCTGRDVTIFKEKLFRIIHEVEKRARENTIEGILWEMKCPCGANRVRKYMEEHEISLTPQGDNQEK